MSESLWIVIVILVVLLILISSYIYKKIKVLKKNKGNKSKKEKKVKVKKDKIKNKSDFMGNIRSSVGVADKFLFRKELKLLIFINKILPQDYIVFPKIGVDLILTPIGNDTVYNTIRGKYVDMVIFEEKSMNPKAVIDLYDGSLGDEPLDIEKPEVLAALKRAEMPVISFKVKSEYTNEEIKEPIFKALKIEDKNEIKK